MRLTFPTLVAIAAVLGHSYVYWRLTTTLVEERNVRTTIRRVLIAMTLWLAAWGPMRGAEGPIARAYFWIAYAWMALMICLVTATVLGDVVAMVYRGVAALRRRSAKRTEPTVERDAADLTSDGRRAFLTRTVPLGVLTGGAVTATYGAYRAFTPPERTEHEIPIANLPRSLEGLSIVQLTDIHVGAFIRESFIDQLVEQANAAKPDLVVITGDLVDGSVPALSHAVGRLSRLDSRFGTFFVTGNHEYYSGPDVWTAFLQRLGMQVLRNRRVVLGDAGGHIDLVGVDDWSRRRHGGYDLETAMAGRDPERPAVLLAHQPSNFEHASALGVDLQISGHTHGGQLFPMTRLVGLSWKYARGLYQHRQSHIYVSRGCGFWGPPARVGSPPEVAKLVLVGA